MGTMCVDYSIKQWPYTLLDQLALYYQNENRWRVFTCQPAISVISLSLACDLISRDIVIPYNNASQETGLTVASWQAALTTFDLTELVNLQPMSNY